MSSRADRKILRCLPTLLVWLGFMHDAGAEVYRWTDAAGKVHYGSRIPAAASDAEPLRSGRVSVVGGGAGEGAIVGESAKVRMFTTQWCGYCKKARNYLRKRGTPFEDLDIEHSHSAKLEYDRLGGHGVPVILVGRQRMNGFDEEEMERLLLNEE